LTRVRERQKKTVTHLGLSRNEGEGGDRRKREIKGNDWSKGVETANRQTKKGFVFQLLEGFAIKGNEERGRRRMRETIAAKIES